MTIAERPKQDGKKDVMIRMKLKITKCRNYCIKFSEMIEIDVELVETKI